MSLCSCDAMDHVLDTEVETIHMGSTGSRRSRRRRRQCKNTQFDFSALNYVGRKDPRVLERKRKKETRGEEEEEEEERTNHRPYVGV